MDLPIDAYLRDIVATVASGKNLVLVAEPGAGKTTRVPRALLENTSQGEVVVLEPRRIAARLAAEFVAQEMQCKVGEEVGYQVRFDSKVSPQTRLRFVTEGVFTRNLSRSLKDVSVVVFDELHERHLETDIALAWCRAAQRKGHRLRIVAMSATLDSDKVAAFLDASVLHVPGRVFPVDVRYSPAGDRLEQSVSRVCRELLNETSAGNILVFLPGVGEIRKALTACKTLPAEVVALYGEQSPDEQNQALSDSRGKRRVILSTNLAESSVTVPGVTMVVDSGLAREAKLDRRGTSALTIQRISQASAKQRTGRAGRLAPGICVRLFHSSDMERREQYHSPEILRSDLAPTVLALAAQNARFEDLELLTTPPAQHVEIALRLLVRLGLISNEYSITERGQRAYRLPLHPRLATLVETSEKSGVGQRGVVLAALLEERFRSSYAGDFSSDALSALAAFELCEAERLSDSEMRARSLDSGAVRRIRRTVQQLLRMTQTSSSRETLLTDDAEELTTALLAAYPDRIACRRSRTSRELVFGDGGSAVLDENSSAHGEWLIAHEIRVPEFGSDQVLSATEISRETLFDVLGNFFEEKQVCDFNSETQRVRISSSLCYGALVVDSSESTSPSEQASEALAQAAWPVRSQLFDLNAAEDALKRIAFAHRSGCTLLSDEDAPLLSNAGFDERFLRKVVGDACSDKLSFADLRKTQLIDFVYARLCGSAFLLLREDAPEQVRIGDGRLVKVSYAYHEPPFVESRLQDFFGLAEGPRLGKARIPLVLHLQAPNGRAVQVTRDLAGFWKTHYPSIRKELMRRYPRHSWPEDPTVPCAPMRPRTPR